MNTHATINKMWEISQSTIYLLNNVYAGSGKLQEHENCMDDMQMKQTDESWWMMSQTSQAEQSHKSITQIICTRRDDIMTKNGKSQTMLLDDPEQLRCLWRHLRLLT